MVVRTLVLSSILVGTACGSGEGHDNDHHGDVTYCDVEPIFAESCQRCHKTPLEYGAPFALMTYEQAYRYRASIGSVIKSEFMPYTGSTISPPVEELSDEDKDLIISWVDDGAKPCE